MSQANRESLQHYLKTNALGAFVIPHSGGFQTEYLLPHQDYLGWVSGFKGTAGLAIITQKAQALFVDGRYFLQAQLQSPDFEILNLSWTSIKQWLIAQKVSAPISLCGQDFSYQHVNQWNDVAHDIAAHFKVIETNPIDSLWKDRSYHTFKPLAFLDEKASGEHHIDKIKRTSSFLKKNDRYFIADIESIAWVFNIRGQDLKYSPLPFAYVFIRGDGRIDFFCAPESVNEELSTHLEKKSFIHNIKDLNSFIKNIEPEKGIIFFDDADTPYSIAEQLLSKKVQLRPNPFKLPKAIKNPTEQAFIRQAHIEDGVALCRFLYWLETTIKQSPLTEIQAAEKLLFFRSQSPSFVSPSFPTISASGPNGAIIHYKPTQESNRVIDPHQFYLLDSGGQYHYGTTDITRTIFLGVAPSEEEKDRYTRVLKGHIALAKAIFPKNTRGSQLDVLARQYLWENCLDYNHGTGHGVGYYLNVHEGPCRISKVAGDCDLEPGMLLSNEPGYYKEDSYGIRIENLVLVSTLSQNSHFYHFDTVSLCPIDLKPVNKNLITNEEKLWINTYHETVCQKLSLFLSREETLWLQEKTKKI